MKETYTEKQQDSNDQTIKKKQDTQDKNFNAAAILLKKSSSFPHGT